MPNNLKKSVQLFLLLLFVANTAFTQNYYDSLSTYIQPLADSHKVETIIAIPFDVMNSNTGSAIKMYEEALKIADQNNNIEQLAQLNEKMAVAHYYNGDYDLSVEASLASIHLYEKLDNSLKAGSAYATLGYQMKRRDLSKAFKYMQKGVRLLEQIDDQPTLSGAYNNFGVLYEMNNDIDSALFFREYISFQLFYSYRRKLEMDISFNIICFCIRNHF